ncbi:MAG TPA: hypothetical protein VHY91_19955 [Pirellulales bacterium]|jgi:hypothetical protein|nr:hypothetical protein [Pirellulales bacterium]
MAKSNDSHAASEPEPIGSEADFLSDQAAAAHRAFSSTLERMRADLGDSADLAAWARRYPWPTMGIAAAAGFLAVVAIGSPPSAQASESFADDTSDDGRPSRSKRGRRAADTDRGLFYNLMSEVLRNFATAAQGALLAAIGARFQPPPVPTDNTPPVADPTVAGGSGGNGFAPSDS